MYRIRIGTDPSTAATIDAGPLRLDLAEQRATLDGRELELSPLLMRLLQILAERPQQLVSRQQLKQQLWPNSEQIDTERRLNTAMRALRSALDDDVDAPRFIETVRSHGYRWIAPNGSDTARRPRLRNTLLTLVALVLLAAAILWLRTDETLPAEPPMSLIGAQTALDQWRSEPTAANLAAAERAVQAALSDSPNSPAAHVLRAQAALEAHWDWRAAAVAYGQALDLDPSNGDARLGLAWLKVNRGDTRGALAVAGQLMRDSVLSGDRRIDLGWLLIRAGRPDLATIACPVSASPASVNALSCAHTASAAVGRLAEARSAALRLMRMRETSPSFIQLVTHMPAEEGYRRFLIWRARNFLPPKASYFDRAQVLAEAGFATEALDHLALSVAAREPLAVKIYSSPAFMTLRTHPRYQAMVREVGASAP